MCPVPTPADGEAQCFATNCNVIGFKTLQGVKHHYNRDHHDFKGGKPRRIRICPGKTLSCERPACKAKFGTLEALDAHVQESIKEHGSIDHELACPAFDLHASEDKVHLPCT